MARPRINPDAAQAAAEAAAGLQSQDGTVIPDLPVATSDPEPTIPAAPVPAAAPRSAQPAYDGNERVRVVIQRPLGVKDSHVYIGFNDFEGQFAYDKPVMLPRKVVDHLRSQTAVEYRADEDGKPVPSYAAAMNIIDAR